MRGKGRKKAMGMKKKPNIRSQSDAMMLAKKKKKKIKKK